MKFWQKAFLAILVLFVVSLNICLYLTSRYSFSLNVKQESNRAAAEYQFISSGIYETISSLNNSQGSTATTSEIDNLMNSFAEYFHSEGVYFRLEQRNKTVFSNIPSAAQSDLNTMKPPSSGFAMTIRTRNRTHYLYIVGTINGLSGHYTLTYVNQLATLYSSHERLSHYLILVSTVVETLLALTLLLVLRRLTYPIRLMQTATRKIARGFYNEQISIRGQDEFHDLAENFNVMTVSIQEKILELDKAVQEKQRLIDNLAHELRTPLTAIRGHAEYLQGAHANEANRIKSAGYIISATDRINDLVHKILDLALVRNRKLDLQVIEASDLLNQVEMLTASTLKGKEIKLDVYCELHEPIIGDEILLQSLLINLIDNAVKASKNHSKIQLRAYFHEGPVLEVRDDGIGMDKEQLSHVFEPFYRVDEARSRSSGGVGLGLSLCKEIASLHRAELIIASEPKKGTTVKIHFTNSLHLPDNSITNPSL